jgi:hypothetical protein
MFNFGFSMNEICFLMFLILNLIGDIWKWIYRVFRVFVVVGSGVEDSRVIDRFEFLSDVQVY